VPEKTTLTRRRLRATWWRGGASLGTLVVLGFGLAACGDGSASPGVASVESNSTTTVAPAAAPSSSAALYDDELKYAQCMRTHGVPNFPDPSSSGSFQMPAGTNRSSPAFAACQKFLPGRGSGGLGSGPPPTAAALAQMLKVSQCMRRHGISDFPDPRTSIPPIPPITAGVISDRDGVILIFPRGFDEQSPQFTQAAAVCGFAVTNH